MSNFFGGINNNNRGLSIPNSRRQGNAGLDGSELITAIISHKNSKGIGLTLDNGKNLNVVRGSVIGEVGDTVFFELQDNSGAAALKQVFPNNSNAQVFTNKKAVANTKELFEQFENAKEYLKEADEPDFNEERLEKLQKANEVAARIKRSLGRLVRITNTSSTAIAKLGAAGLDIGKISVGMLDNVVSQLDEAQKQNNLDILNQLEESINNILDLDESQITRALVNETPLTLENLKIIKSSNHDYAYNTNTEPISEDDWDKLVSQVEKFLISNELPVDNDNMARAKYLLDNNIGLTIDNFERLIFLQDIEGNIDLDTLFDRAKELYQQGEPVEKAEAFYKPAIYMSLESINKQIERAEIRLKMSYEANIRFINTDLAIDIETQRHGLAALKAYEEEMLAQALRQANVDDNAQNRYLINNTYQNIKTLDNMQYDAFGEITGERLALNLDDIGAHIASQKYDANATVAQLKYGDYFSKVSEQFSPLLKELGFDDTKPNLRAAKILSMNNMDIDNKNLNDVKVVDQKINAITEKLHPLIAAHMISDGLNPSTMHMDEILAYIDKFNNEFGSNDSDKLYRNIMDMDNHSDITPDVRKKVIELYQMLHKITKNNNAGLGFAINAGIELTLQNLLDFSKNFNATKAKHNSINYSVADEQYQKQLVSSFVSLASPKPMIKFVQAEDFNQNLRSPLEQAVDKMQEIAQTLRDAGEIEDLDTARISAEIEELAATSKENIRYILNRGLPMTLGTIRAMRGYKPHSMGFDALEDLHLDEALTLLQSTELEGFVSGKSAAELNDDIKAKAEELMENSDSLEELKAADILLKSLDFRSQMLAHSKDHSFSMTLNGRAADVSMYVLNENIDLRAGVRLYLSLDTQMGAIQALLNMDNAGAELLISAEEQARGYLEANSPFFHGFLMNIGLSNVDMRYVDKLDMKNHLTLAGHMTI